MISIRLSNNNEVVHTCQQVSVKLFLHSEESLSPSQTEMKLIFIDRAKKLIYFD